MMGSMMSGRPNRSPSASELCSQCIRNPPTAPCASTLTWVTHPATTRRARCAPGNREGGGQRRGRRRRGSSGPRGSAPRRGPAPEYTTEPGGCAASQRTAACSASARPAPGGRGARPAWAGAAPPAGRARAPTRRTAKGAARPSKASKRRPILSWGMLLVDSAPSGSPSTRGSGSATSVPRPQPPGAGLAACWCGERNVEPFLLKASRSGWICVERHVLHSVSR